MWTEEKWKMAQYAVAVLGVTVGAAFLALLFLWLVSLAGCGPACTAAEVRCADNAVEVCDANGEWEVAMNCDDVSSAECAVWMCCPACDGGPACLPAHQCEDDQLDDGGAS